MFESGGWYSTSLEHFLDDEGELVAQPLEAAGAARAVADLVLAATWHESDEEFETGLRCPVRRGRGRCRGRVMTVRHGSVVVHWECPSCRTGGQITEWRGTAFDQSDLADEGDVRGRVVSEAPLAALDELLVSELPPPIRAMLLRSMRVDERIAELELESKEVAEFRGALEWLMRGAGTQLARAAARVLEGLDVADVLGGLEIDFGPSPSKGRATGSAADVVRNLFEDIPQSEDELEARLRGLDPAAARECVLTRFEGSADPIGEHGLVAEILGRVGVGPEVARLERMATDSARAPDERAAAALVLHQVAPEAAERAMAAVPPEERARTMAESIRALLRTIEDEEATGAELAKVIERVEGTGDEGVREFIDAMRREEGIPASVAYARLLDSGKATLQRFAIAAIAAEGGVGCDVLDEFVARARNPLVRQLVTRVRAETDERPREAPSGAAWISSTDGVGAVILLVRQPRADAASRVLNVVFHLDGDIRDGFHLPRASDNEWRDLLARYLDQSELGVTEISVEEGVRTFQDALTRARARGRVVPNQVRSIVCRLERIACPQLAEIAAPDAPSSPRSGRIDRLLDEGEFDSWFLSRDDMAMAKLTTSQLCGRDAEPVLAAIERSPIAERLRLMAEHMVRFFHCRGDRRRESTMALASKELREDFCNSTIARRFVAGSPRAADDDGKPFLLSGDPDLRRELRRTYFPGVEVAQGRDLLRLDCLEAAAQAARRHVASLPKKRRPHGESIPKLADVVVRRTFEADWRDIRLKDVVRDLRRLLDLEARETEDLAVDMLGALNVFRDLHCERCPVSCFERLDDDLTDEFFAEEHPCAGEGVSLFEGAPIPTGILSEADDEGTDLTEGTRRPIGHGSGGSGRGSSRAGKRKASRAARKARKRNRGR